MSVAKDFFGTPLGLLVSQPIIEVAKGQAELCNVYLSQLFSLAFKTMPKVGEEIVEAKTIKFKLNRTVVDAATGDAKVVPVEVEAPLLSLVPVPAFTMEEATVHFTMEVKDVVTTKNATDEKVDFSSGVSAWGFSASVSGSVSASRENTRTTDKSAKYDIYARAAQQPPAEGMAKLTSIFASVVEPITVAGGK